MSRYGRSPRVMMNGHDEKALIELIRELEGLMDSPKSGDDAKIIGDLRGRIIRTFTLADFESFAEELKGMIRQCERERPLSE